MRYKAVLEPWPACPVSPQRQVRLSSHRKMLGQRQGLLRARRADRVCVIRREFLGGSLWRGQLWLVRPSETVLGEAGTEDLRHHQVSENG